MDNINYKEKVEKICEWIKKTVHEARFENLIVAVSGGVDSAVAVSLATKALGSENVYAVLLPWGMLNEEGTSDSHNLLRGLEFSESHIILQDIQESADAVLKDISEQDVIRRGNVMARIRMVYLYDFAKKYKSLVCGTENKSEYYLGYFTRFGDEAADIEPIRSLYKTQIWEMAKYLDIPKKIIDKAPTAGLWKSQTDEGEFGFSYKDADSILYHHFEEGLPEEGIVDLGIERALVRKVLGRVKNNDFKHHLPKVFDA